MTAELMRPIAAQSCPCVGGELNDIVGATCHARVSALGKCPRAALSVVHGSQQGVRSKGAGERCARCCDIPKGCTSSRNRKRALHERIAGRAKRGSRDGRKACNGARCITAAHGQCRQVRARGRRHHCARQIPAANSGGRQVSARGSGQHRAGRNVELRCTRYCDVGFELNIGVVRNV